MVTDTIRKNLARHIGVVYHKFAGDIEIWINDSKVKFIDPLFLTPGLLGYDLDSDRAQLVASESIIVKDDDGNELGTIMARYAAMPPTFALKQEVKGNKGTQAQDQMPTLDFSNERLQWIKTCQKRTLYWY